MEQDSVIESTKKTAEFIKRISQTSVGSDFSFINSAGIEESKSPIEKSADPWKGIYQEEIELQKSQQTLHNLVEKMERRKEQVKAQLAEIDQQID